ncbi:MAG TPA: hypothetical protein DCM05_05910 [Elusimicrobia bacterium]|nr:hypothetical protein [Elusimicrobiota bacterium]
MRAYLGFFALFLAFGTAHAGQPPLRIDFQGKLTNASDAPRNGLVLLNFRLYGAPSGGSALWSETHPSVPVADGVFSVLLGSWTQLSPTLFTGTSSYLEIDVDPAGAEPLETLWPRQRLMMAPWAFTATQLAACRDIPINAGTSYSTFTIAGNLQIQHGISAGTMTLTGSLTASSGTFTTLVATEYGVLASSGMRIRGGTLQASGKGGVLVSYGIAAATGTFTATGNAVFSVTSASGMRVQGGTLGVEGSNGLVATYGISAATASFTAVSTFSLVSSSGLRVQDGGLQIGPSAERTLSDLPDSGTLFISSNAVIVGSMTAGDFNFVLLSSASLAAAAATLTTSFQNDYYSTLRILIHIAGVAATTIPRIRFNNDAGANYAYRISDTNGNPSNSTGQTFINFQEANANTRGLFDLRVRSIPNLAKLVYIGGTRGSAATAAPLFHNGAGTWNNTTAWITQVQLLNSAGTTFTAGTTIRVFGSK